MCGTAREGAPMPHLRALARDEAVAQESAVPGAALLGGLAGAFLGGRRDGLRGGLGGAAQGALLGGFLGAMTDAFGEANLDARTEPHPMRRARPAAHTQEAAPAQQRSRDSHEPAAVAAASVGDGGENGAPDAAGREELPPDVRAALEGMPPAFTAILERLHRRQQGPLEALEGLEALIGQLQAGQATDPASDRDISRLPTHTFEPRTPRAETATNGEGEGEGEAKGGAAPSCAVCLEEFARGDELMTLPCFHSFHTACCEQWLRQSAVCPVCKHRVDDRGDGIEGLVEGRGVS